MPSVPCRRPSSSALVVGALRAALAVVSPTSCPGCGLEDVELCPSCTRRLDAAPVTGALPRGLAVTGALRYEHEVRGVVLAWKQGGRSRLSRALAVPFARAVAAASTASPVPPDLVVAVPPSAAGRRRRGWDPVPHLAARARVPLAPGLLRVGGGPSQKGRDRVSRARDDALSLVARPGAVAGRRVLLVDDVLTTGATVLRARAALLEAGADVVGAACLAVVPLASTASGGTVLADGAPLPGTLP